MANIDSQFNVTDHVIPCQHIRGYSHAVKDPVAALRLSIKQYVPVSQTRSSPNQVTVIAAHANGIVKVRA